MRTECAWCGVILHGVTKPTEPVSHGICPDCDRLAREDAGLLLPLPVPGCDEPEDSPGTDPALKDEREVMREAEEREEG